VDLENWMWKMHKIGIRGGDPGKLRLSTPYYFEKKDIDRFLEKLDEYKHEKKLH
jgi:isopenicillin-N epimerase